MGDLQGLLDTPGGDERVVLKRVKARVQVRTQHKQVDPQLTLPLTAACAQHTLLPAALLTSCPVLACMLTSCPVLACVLGCPAGC
jgi:hypothetical protein